MSSREEAIVIACGSDRMVGIITRPPAQSPQHDLALVIVVGGPQYRAGSHRQFVQLARAAASAGYVALRFDFRGMGDSEGQQRSFEDTTDDLASALAALQQAEPQVKRFALWGLCDGASAALLYMHRVSDLRVAGLVMLNPWVRSEASLAKAQVKHYYRQRLMDPAFWKKLLSGQVAASALTGLVGNLRRAFASKASPAAASYPYQTRMAQAWLAFRGPILLVLSGNDLTAKEFLEYTAADPGWQQVFRSVQAQRLDLPGADHTFSQSPMQRAAEDATCRWLSTL